MDITGGTTYDEYGTSQLLSVPYALHAKTAESTDSYTETQNLADVLELSNDGNTLQIKNISDPTDAKDAATKAYVDVLLKKIELLESIAGVGEPVTDIEGNSYQTIRIGTQIWMTENLKTTRYKDATEIQLVTDNTTWSNLATGAYCWYDNDEALYGDTYGLLYNWYTVNTGNLCPTGWHIPVSTEWTTLSDYLGGASVAGGKLKEFGTMHWNYPNSGATNETGFTALPGGYRLYDGTFRYNGEYAYWWTSTEVPAIDAWYQGLLYNTETLAGFYTNKHYGLSVRCVKD